MEDEVISRTLAELEARLTKLEDTVGGQTGIKPQNEGTTADLVGGQINNEGND